MDDIFLSYSEKDRAIAAQITALLQSAGWSVWWDREIPAGKTWRDMIEGALQNMRCMVVLWSANSIKSDWVKEEADEGRSQRKLIPVLIESVRPPVGFREIQAADLIHWDGSTAFPGFQQLIADLESMLGKPSRPIEQKNKIAQPPISAPTPGGTTDREAQTTGWMPKDFSIFPWLASISWKPWAVLAVLIIIGILGVKLMRPSRNPVLTEPISYPSAQPAHPNMKQTRDPAAATVVDSPATVPQPLAPYSDSTKTPMVSAPGASPPERRPKIDGPSQPATRRGTPNRVSTRCSELLMRVQVGEPISEENRAWFDKECKE